MASHIRYPYRKITLLLSLLLTLAGRSHAQFSMPVSLDDRVAHSSLIIEGYIADQFSFWDKDHRLIYTRNRVVVDKVFKGVPTSDTLDIITTGGMTANRGLLVSDEANLISGQTGVFLLNMHRRGDRIPEEASTHPYELYAAAQGSILFNTLTHTAADVHENFGDITGGLYKRLASLTGQGARLLHPRIVSFSATSALAANITGFSPAIVHAGAILDPTNNVLTINGTGFGTGSGVAAVVFQYADNPAGTISIAYNSVYVQSWSPTKVVIRVPYGAGTGTLGITDAGGTTVTASSSLIVDYSIMAITYGGPVPAAAPYQVKPMNLNGSGGVTILYSSSNANGGADFSTAPERLAFERATDTWIKSAGYNLTLGGTTTSQVVADDDVNIIMFDNTATGVAVLPAGVLGVTYTWIGGCGDGTWFSMGYDMVYRRTGVSLGSSITFNSATCAPGSGEVDFESVALHELGHSLTLGHIIDPNNFSDPAKVMNYSISLGRLRRSLDYASLAAGTYAMTASGLSYGCAPYTAEMTALANQRPSTNDCPGTFPSTPTAPGTYAVNLYYSTSDRTADPSSVQMTCGATTIGRYNSVMLPIYTGVSGSTLNMSVSNYATLVDYSACSGMGVRMAIFQTASCPGTSWPAAISCQDITGNGSLTPVTGLSSNTNYVIVFDGLLNTKAKFDITLAGSVLPVTLVDFKGSISNGKAVLNWTTTMEQNNSKFQVEKTTNGKDFTVIGTLPGHGNSTDRIDYRFIDPSTIGDIQQYRLRQVDQDGHFFLSQLVTLRTQGSQYGAELKVVNPVGQDLRLQFGSVPHGPVQIRIFDIQGRLLMVRVAEATGTTLVVPVGQTMVAKGTYVLHVQGSDLDEVRKIQSY